MWFSSNVDILDFVLAGAILFGAVTLAIVINIIIRRIMHRIASATRTQLDDMLFKAIEWPIIVIGIVVGAYLGIVSLPFTTATDFEIRRIFHAGYIALGGWTLISVIDALLRWFRLEITSKTKTALDDWIISFLRLVSPLVVILTVVIFCLDLFQIDTSYVKSWFITHGTRIGLVFLISAATLMILGVVGSRTISTVVLRGTAGQSEEEVQKRVNTLSGVLITAGQVFIIVISGFVILSELKINIAPILAGASVVGVALGLGAQNFVKDIIAGFFILMENQFRIGDVVNIAGVGGVVEDLNLRRTVLRDMDGTVHSIPNGQITVSSNLTKEWSRVNLDITVAYNTDLDHATEVINQVCKEIAGEAEWSSIIMKVPQVIRVENFGESGIDLKILGDTKPTQQWLVAGEIRKRVKKAFDKEGIDIPWPHVKVYFGNTPVPNEVAKKTDRN
jgi:moderate conductance mechanosensitive channel